MSLGVVAVLLLILRAGHRIALKQSQKALALFITNDSAPSFITRSDGEIFSANAAAEKAFGTTKGTILASVLVDRIGNPGPMLFRLQSRAAASGSAREKIVTNSGQILLSIHALDNNNFAWRIEPQNTQASGSLPSDSRILPMLMVGRSGAILSMNHAVRQFIGARGKSLDAVFAEQIVVPGTVMQISTTAGNCPALAAQTDSGGRA